ncbi:MAG: ABC transporter ATP-binding protein [Patescibacteria group bacterium]|jgi:ABC-2 type transport system ATP-binding protein
MDSIEVKNLVKNYGRLKAVDGVCFEVRQGEIFGLLGENGAGKTTTLEMIEGLRKPTSGSILMLGTDLSHGMKDEIKEKIGVQLQSSAYYNFLTLKEILELFGGFYQKSIPALELLKMVNLDAKANSLVKNLSGGQKQRFSIVAALVNDPEIVFLDEPTTGLDPIARRRLWDIIVKIKSQGKTIIITTHYMEEAEVLCDRIAIMDKGKILKMGETHKLIEATKTPYKISFILSKPDGKEIDEIAKFGKLENLAGKSNHYEMHLKTQDAVNKSINIIQKLNPESLTVGRASLEDLFVELTGKNIEE